MLVTLLTLTGWSLISYSVVNMPVAVAKEVKKRRLKNTESNMNNMIVPKDSVIVDAKFKVVK